MDGGNGEQNPGCTCGGGAGGGCGCGIGGCVGGSNCGGTGKAWTVGTKQSKARSEDPDIDSNEEPNIEDYLMNMTSISDCSRGKNQMPNDASMEKEGPESKPIIKSLEKEIGPGVTQYTTHISEVDPCSGKKAVMHSSHILNRKTGTLISVQRTDYTGGCPNKDQDINYGSTGGIFKHVG